MFDLGWTELLLIGIVALIVVGPKDLPGMFRTLGRFTGKMRNMAREFSRAMNEAADEAGVKDVSNTLKAATNPSKMGLDRLNEAADKFEKWQPGKSTTKSEMGPNTAKLSEERAAAAKKIHDSTAKRVKERMEAEKAAEAEAAKPKPAPATKAKTKPAAKPKPKPAASTAKAKPAAKPKTKPAAKPKAKPAAKRTTKPKVKPAEGDSA